MRDYRLRIRYGDPSTKMFQDFCSVLIYDRSEYLDAALRMICQYNGIDPEDPSAPLRLAELIKPLVHPCSKANKALLDLSAKISGIRSAPPAMPSINTIEPQLSNNVTTASDELSSDSTENDPEYQAKLERLLASDADEEL